MVACGKFNRQREQVETPVHQDVMMTWNGADIGSAGAPVTFRRERYISDVNTPQFKKRIAAGEIINNPCIITAVTEDEEPGFVTGTSSVGNVITYDGPNSGLWLGHTGYLSVPDVDTITLDAKAKLEAIAQMDSTPYAFMEDAGELIGGLLTIGRNFRHIADLSGKHLKPCRDSISFRECADTVWLEYAFKYRPLVFSAMDAYESTMTSLGKRPLRQRAGARESAVETDADLYEKTIGTSVINTCTVSRESSTEYSTHAAIQYEVSNPLDEMKQHQLGLRVKDLPKTAWALLPYSFMIDRVMDIATGVQAFTNLVDPNVRILAGSVTRKKTFTKKCTLSSLNHADWSFSVGAYPHLRVDFEYQRSCWYPTVLDVIPPVDMSGIVDNAHYIVDLAALISARWRGNPVFTKLPRRR